MNVYWACDYSYILGLKLIHVSDRLVAPALIWWHRLSIMVIPIIIINIECSFTHVIFNTGIPILVGLTHLGAWIPSKICFITPLLHCVWTYKYELPMQFVESSIWPNCRYDIQFHKKTMECNIFSKTSLQKSYVCKRPQGGNGCWRKALLLLLFIMLGRPYMAYCLACASDSM